MDINTMPGAPAVPHTMTFSAPDLAKIVYALEMVGTSNLYGHGVCYALANRIVALGIAQVKEDQRMGEATYADL